MKRLWTIGLVAAVAVGVVGCAGPEPAPEPERDLTLTVAERGTTSFDVNAGLDWECCIYQLEPVFDTLLIPGPGADFSPGLAESWEFGDDGLELMIELRDGVTDSAGDAFDAEVAKMNFDAIKASPAGWMIPTVESVDVVDDLTVVLNLSAFDPTLLQSLARVYMAGASMHGAADAATNPVGTGAYVLDPTRTTPDVEYVYTKRDDAWDADRYQFNTLVVKVMADGVARFNALRSGQVDLALLDPGAAAEAEAAGLELTSYTGVWWGLQLGDLAGAYAPPMAELAVRQAISHAFDREAINETLYQGLGAPTNQMFNPSTPFYREDRADEYAYDVEEAKALLAEAGYPDGFAMTMPWASVPAHNIFQPVVKSALADIGIDVTFEPTFATVNDWLARAEPGSMGIATGRMVTSLSLAVSPTGALNVWDNTDPELEEYIAATADGSLTQEERDEAAADIGDFLLDNAWFVGVGRVPWVFGFDADVAVEADKSAPLALRPRIYEIVPAD